MARLVVEARTLQSGLSGVGLWVRDVCRGRQGLRVRALWEGRPPCGPMERPGRARVRACSQVVECADAEVSEALLLWIDGCPGSGDLGEGYDVSGIPWRVGAPRGLSNSQSVSSTTVINRGFC